MCAYLYGAVRNQALNQLKHRRVERHWREAVAREAAAGYDYFRAERELAAEDGELVARDDTTRVALAPSGTTLGAYVTQRVRPWAPLAAELGVRYDRHSHTGDRYVSPRLSAAYGAGGRTAVRGAWGRYRQAQGIHQLQVQDGVDRFSPAELAEQRVVGVERQLTRRISARVEGYERRLLRLRPRFASLDNSIDVFPEIEPDRRLLAPYHRLDVRATKRFDFARSRLSAFVDVFNVYNRRNARALDQWVAVQGGRVTVGSSLDAQLPRVPSFGLAWEF